MVKLKTPKDPMAIRLEKAKKRPVNLNADQFRNQLPQKKLQSQPRYPTTQSSGKLKSESKPRTSAKVNNKSFTSAARPTAGPKKIPAPIARAATTGPTPPAQKMKNYSRRGAASKPTRRLLFNKRGRIRESQIPIEPNPGQVTKLNDHHNFQVPHDLPIPTSPIFSDVTVAMTSGNWKMEGFTMNAKTQFP